MTTRDRVIFDEAGLFDYSRVEKNKLIEGGQVS